MNPIPGSLKDALEKGHDRAFPVGARNMDDRRKPFIGISQRFKKTLDTVQ